MKNLFIKYELCGLVKYLQKEGNDELERELKAIGGDIAQRIAIMKSFKRDKDIDSLVYRITFDLLPCLYSTERYIEKGKDPEILFYIYEHDPVFADFIYDEHQFCASSVIAGIIEMILAISGFKCQVLAYNCPDTNEKRQIVYTISRIEGNKHRKIHG